MKIRLLLLISSILIVSNLFAQDVFVQDFRTRFSLSLNYKPIKEITLNWTEEARFKNNSSKFDRLYSGLGVTYNAHKNFSMGAIYEFQVIQKGVDYFQLRHRVKFVVQPNVSFGRFNLSLREMPQMTYSNAVDWELRSRLKLNYSFMDKHLKPYISVEMYNPLKKNVGKDWLSKMNYRAGLEWKIDSVDGLEFYYMFEHEVKNKAGNHIVGVAYNLGL
jgi:hypothetical protein